MRISIPRALKECFSETCHLVHISPGGSIFWDVHFKRLTRSLRRTFPEHFAAHTFSFLTIITHIWGHPQLFMLIEKLHENRVHRIKICSAKIHISRSLSSISSTGDLGMRSRLRCPASGQSRLYPHARVSHCVSGRFGADRGRKSVRCATARTRSGFHRRWVRKDGLHPGRVDRSISVGIASSWTAGIGIPLKICISTGSTVQPVRLGNKCFRRV
jgi:hypothetical protein